MDQGLEICVPFYGGLSSWLNTSTARFIIIITSALCLIIIININKKWWSFLSNNSGLVYVSNMFGSGRC